MIDVNVCNKIFGTVSLVGVVVCALSLSLARIPFPPFGLELQETVPDLKNFSTTIDDFAGNIPGGFKMNGGCNLKSMKGKENAVDLAMFVKHGLHTTAYLRKSCKSVKRYVLSLTPVNWQHTVSEFVNGNGSQKMLAVRSQASFYKSVFNHVCNKDKKKKWRQQHDIDCSREGEFAKLLELNGHEISAKYDPFLLKEIIMQASDIHKILLVDYTCIPKVVNSLCDEPMKILEEMPSNSTNSAASQNYTDFWTMHNHTFSPNSQFWDDIYDRLSKVCCLELIKNVSDNKNAANDTYA